MPIPFAAVVVKGTMFGVACDENGNFTLRYDPPLDSGTFRLLITSIGFNSIEILVTYSSDRDLSLGMIKLEKNEGDIIEFYVTVRRPWYKKVWSSLTKPFRN